MYKFYAQKSKEIRIQTLYIHQNAPQTRIASSLSPIEIFVCLFYSKLMKFNPKNPLVFALETILKNCTAWYLKNLLKQTTKNIWRSYEI